MPKFLHDTVYSTKGAKPQEFKAGDEVPAGLDFGKHPAHTLKHVLSPEDLEAYLAPPPAPEPVPEPEPAPVSAEDPKDDR